MAEVPKPLREETPPEGTLLLWIWDDLKKITSGDYFGKTPRDASKDYEKILDPPPTHWLLWPEWWPTPTTHKDAAEEASDPFGADTYKPTEDPITEETPEEESSITDPLGVQNLKGVVWEVEAVGGDRLILRKGDEIYIDWIDTLSERWGITNNSYSGPALFHRFILFVSPRAKCNFPAGTALAEVETPKHKLIVPLSCKKEQPRAPEKTPPPHQFSPGEKVVVRWKDPEFEDAWADESFYGLATFETEISNGRTQNTHAYVAIEGRSAPKAFPLDCLSPIGSPEVEINTPEGNHPVTCTGTINNIPFYFQALGKQWLLGIGSQEKNAKYKWSYHEETEDEVCMDEENVRSLIAKTAQKHHETLIEESLKSSYES